MAFHADLGSRSSWPAYHRRTSEDNVWNRRNHRSGRTRTVPPGPSKNGARPLHRGERRRLLRAAVVALASRRLSIVCVWQMDSSGLAMRTERLCRLKRRIYRSYRPANRAREPRPSAGHSLRSELFRTSTKIIRRVCGNAFGDNLPSLYGMTENASSSSDAIASESRRSFGAGKGTGFFLPRKSRGCSPRAWSPHGPTAADSITFSPFPPCPVRGPVSKASSCDSRALFAESLQATARLR